MKHYEKADQSVMEMLTEVVKARHSELKEVRFDVLFVFSDGDGPALSSGGYAALAQVRILPLKQRTAGRGDAEIVVDGAAWKESNVRRRKALLDHELTHLKPKLDKMDRPVMDALKRPRLVTVLHDWHFGWFDAVAEAWGEDSVEVEQARRIQETSGQFYFELTEGKGERETRNANGETFSADDVDEELVQECIEVIRSTNKANCPILQRRLRIGYTKAARVMDILEERGVVGPHKGAEPRDIIKLPELQEA